MQTSYKVGDVVGSVYHDDHFGVIIEIDERPGVKLCHKVVRFHGRPDSVTRLWYTEDELLLKDRDITA